LEARPGFEAVEILHDLAAVKQVAIVEQVAIEAGPVRHLPGVGHLARHVDQIDRTLAGHRREQRESGLRQRRIMRDQPGPRASYLLLVDGGHSASPDANRHPGRAGMPILGLRILGQNRKYGAYSTVTLFARLRGWSTSVPLSTAT